MTSGRANIVYSACGLRARLLGSLSTDLSLGNFFLERAPRKGYEDFHAPQLIQLARDVSPSRKEKGPVLLLASARKGRGWRHFQAASLHPNCPRVRPP